MKAGNQLRPSIMVSPAVKARMVCLGVDCSVEVQKKLRDDFSFDSGFIHGCILLLGGYSPVNTSVVDVLPPHPLRPCLEIHEGTFILNDIDGAFSCPPLRQPRCMSRAFGRFNVAEYFRMHSATTLFWAPIRQCIFGAIGQECRFCTYEMKKVEYVPNTDFRHAIETIFLECPEIRAVAIGGGTPVLSDYGAAYYSGLVELLREGRDVDVSVELVPPPNRSDILRLADSGATSIIMSLEVWNEERRREIAPGKAKVSKADYFRRWSDVVSIFGPGSVSSVLLVGLEPPEETAEGIEALCDAGVIPTLIPFRPYPGIHLASQPLADPEEYLQLSRQCAHSLARHGLVASKQAGCTACGGCSLEVILERAESAANGNVR